MGRTVVYVRVPRPRNGVEDPPTVDWTQANEEELWSILRTSANEVDWAALAAQFGVPVLYILQQAAWLYEKELKLLKQQMTQINVKASTLGNFEERTPRGTPFAPPPSSSHTNVFVPPPTSQRVRPESRAPSTASHSLNLGLGNESVRNPSGRRLLSVSRAIESDDASSSQSFQSIDDFVPREWQQQPSTSNAGAGSSYASSSGDSDNSVTQSALEEALMERSNP